MVKSSPPQTTSLDIKDIIENAKEKLQSLDTFKTQISASITNLNTSCTTNNAEIKKLKQEKEENTQAILELNSQIESLSSWFTTIIKSLSEKQEISNESASSSGNKSANSDQIDDPVRGRTPSRGTGRGLTSVPSTSRSPSPSRFQNPSLETSKSTNSSDSSDLIDLNYINKNYNYMLNGGSYDIKNDVNKKYKIKK